MHNDTERMVLEYLSIQSITVDLTTFTSRDRTSLTLTQADSDNGTATSSDHTRNPQVNTAIYIHLTLMTRL